MRREVPERVAWFSLLACVFLVPLATSRIGWLGIGPLTLDEFEVVKAFVLRVCVLVGLAAWSWALFTSGGRVRRTPADLLILGFIGWVGVASVTSVHPAIALPGKYRAPEGLIDLVAYALVFFLGVQLVRTQRDAREIATWLTASGAVVAIIGLAQSLGVTQDPSAVLTFEAERAWSTFGNPVPLGGFLVLATPVSLAVALSETRTPTRAAFFAAFFAEVLCLLLTYTRGAWLGAFLGVVLLAAALGIRRIRLSHAEIGVGAAAGVVGAAVIARTLSTASSVVNVWERLRSVFDVGSGSTSSRVLTWKGALDAVADRPITGFGPGTFRYVHSKYKPLELVQETGSSMFADNAHNYVVNLAATIGLPGAALYLAAVVVALGRSARLVFSSAGGRTALVVAGFWSAAAGYLLYQLAGVPTIGAGPVFWIALAVALAPAATSVELRALRAGRTLRLAVVAACAALAALAALPPAADHAAVTAMRVGHPDRLAAADRAVRLAPWNDTYPMLRGLAYEEELWLPAVQRLDQARQSGGESSAALTEATAAFANTESAYRAAIEAVPLEYDNYVLLAVLYNSAGRVLDDSYFSSAGAVAREALTIEPLGVSARVQLADSLWQTGQRDEALRVVTEALTIDSTFAPAALLAAEIGAGTP